MTGMLTEKGFTRRKVLKVLKSHLPNERRYAS